MKLCTNRSEGFGPISHLYSHILTSCFLDTILVPLCTWLYLLAIAILFVLPARSKTRPQLRHRGPNHQNKGFADVEDAAPSSLWRPWKDRSRVYRVFLTCYYLLNLAQVLMCVLEITRLALAHLGIGLLPFTFVSLVVAAAVRLSVGLRGRLMGWRVVNMGLWIVLAAMNGIKVAEEVRELDGLGGRQRNGSKYMAVDELTDVGVMVGVYIALGILEASLDPY